MREQLDVAFHQFVFFSVRFVAKRYMLQQKCPKKLRARNKTVQLLTFYTDSESHSA